MPQNLKLEMDRDKNIARVLRSHADEDWAAEIIKKSINAVVVKNYQTRGAAGRLTGEWIVFAKIQAVNYYLTLADDYDGDEQTLRRVQAYRKLDKLPDLQP